MGVSGHGSHPGQNWCDDVTGISVNIFSGIFTCLSYFNSSLPGVNFINILHTPFLYKSVLGSFSLVKVWLCNFLAQKYWHKNWLVKCWRNWLQAVKQSSKQNGSAVGGLTLLPRDVFTVQTTLASTKLTQNEGWFTFSHSHDKNIFRFPFWETFGDMLTKN